MSDLLDRFAKVAARVAPACFVLLVMIHVATFLSFFPTQIGAWISLLFFPVIFAMFGGAILHLNSLAYGSAFGTGALRSTREARRAIKKIILDNVPITVIVAFFAIFLYSWLTFFSTASEHSDGQVARRDGRYVIEFRGEVVEEVTEEEYRRLNALEVRRTTRHMFPFLALGTAYFMFVPQGVRRRTTCRNCGARLDPSGPYCMTCGVRAEELK